jgi:iron complex transport system ATP-binding protein
MTAPPPPPAGAPLLPIRSLCLNALHFRYGAAAVFADLSLAFGPGERVALVGPNGCGKSTLLKLLVGALAPASGHIAVDDVPLSRLPRPRAARTFALVPQMAGDGASLGAAIGGSGGGFTVRQVVLMARYPAHADAAGPLGRLVAAGGGFETPADLDAAHQALWAADVHHLADRPADTLSGGERQRVAIARALAQQTPVLLLDEPTSALDLFHQLDLLAHLDALAAAGTLVLLVTHDLPLAARWASRVIVLDAGRPVADAPPAAALTPAVLEPVYHVRVHPAVPTLHFTRH